MDRSNEEINQTLSDARTTVCLDSLIEYAAERLAYSVRKARLKLELSLVLYGEDPDKPGQPIKRIAPRTYETLVGKARAILKERSLLCSEEARQESIGFYTNLLANPDTSDSCKIKARENLDLIMAVSNLATTRGVVQHQIIDLDKLGLTIDQKKKILEGMRGSNTTTSGSS